MKSIDRLQVIFKIVERCNLNCSYCYYYSGANTDTHLRPPVIDRTNVLQVAAFLAQACLDIDIRHITIVFHGGEPTMMKPALFDWVCERLKESLLGRTKFDFCIQTNGVHLSDSWMSVLSRHGVAVGVSIDGTKDYNDTFRIDHQGRGSHDRIVSTIRKLNAQSSAGVLPPVGTVSVLNHDYDYQKIFDHLAGDLEVRRMNFLFPDGNWDALPASVRAYGRILSNIFDKWLESDIQAIRVRQFEDLLAYFRKKVVRVPDDPAHVRNQIVVVQSDGNVAIDDTFMPAETWYKKLASQHVSMTSLLDWLNQDVFAEVREARASLPGECSECRWAGVCRGGDIENRYAEATGFSRKTVYCESLLDFYEHVERVLVDNGYPQSRFDRALENAKEVVD